MKYHKSLKITQKEPAGAIEILLDGEPLTGCTAATLEFAADRLPTLTTTVYVTSVEVDIKDNAYDGEM